MNDTTNTTTVLVKPGQSEVLITKSGQEETYSLNTAPGPGMRLVKEGKQEILQQLNIESVILNLHNAAGLLFVAYHALAGTQLQSRASGLQNDLLTLSRQAVVATQEFQSLSQEVIGYIVEMYRHLLAGEEKYAVKQLTHAGERAAKMATTSEHLAIGFETIATTTEGVLEATHNEESLQYQEAEKLKKQLEELKGKVNGKRKLQEELVKGIGEMQTLYDEAKASQQEASDRAFILGLVSAVTSAIGAGVGMYAASQNPAGAVMHTVNAQTGAATTTTATTITTTADVKEKELELEEAKKQADEAKKDADEKQTTATKDAADAQTKLKDFEDADGTAKTKETAALAADKPGVPEADKEQAKKEAKDARDVADIKLKISNLQTKTKEDSEKTAHDAATKAEKLKTAAAAATEALNNLTKGLQTMQEQAAAASATVQNEKMTYLNKKLQMEEQNREALAFIVEYAKLIDNNQTNTNIARTAVETLHAALACLKEVVTALQSSALFWRSMEQYCHRLASSKLSETVNDLQDMALETRQREYQSPDFMYALVQYTARWVALNAVMTDYLAATNKVFNRLRDNINLAPSIENAKAVAPQLAKEMLAETQKQLGRSEQATVLLKAELAAVQQPVPAS